MTRGHLAMFLLSGVATLYVILRVPLPFSLVSRHPSIPGHHLQPFTPTSSTQAHPPHPASLPGPLVRMPTPHGPSQGPWSVYAPHMVLERPPALGSTISCLQSDWRRQVLSAAALVLCVCLALCPETDPCCFLPWHSRGCVGWSRTGPVRATPIPSVEASAHFPFLNVHVCRCAWRPEVNTGAVCLVETGS